MTDAQIKYFDTDSLYGHTMTAGIHTMFDIENRETMIKGNINSIYGIMKCSDDCIANTHRQHASEN